MIARAFPVPCRQVLKVEVLEYQVGQGTRVKGTIIVGYPVTERHRVFGKDLESRKICDMLVHSKFIHNAQAYIILALPKTPAFL